MALHLGRFLRMGLAISGVILPAGVGAAADRDLTAWQEITVLTVSKLEAAAASCGYMIDGKQLDLLLVSADLNLNEVHGRHRSTALQQQIDAVNAAYRADRQGACAQAWDTFGPDGTAHGYLTR